MPELWSGARRSKRVGDLETPPQPAVQEQNWELPAQSRTRRVGGRGKGNVVVDEGPSPAVPARLRAAGRSRGLEPELCQVLPEAAPLAAAEPVFNQAEVAADKDIAMEGGSADKLVGVEEEASTTPIPDLVLHITN